MQGKLEQAVKEVLHKIQELKCDWCGKPLVGGSSSLVYSVHKDCWEKLMNVVKAAKTAAKAGGEKELEALKSAVEELESIK